MGSEVLRPGQKPQTGVLLSQNAGTTCILLNGHALPCTAPVNLCFIPSLSRGNLFPDWVTTVASL